MSLSRETQEALRGLGVTELPEEWVQAVWEGNFCESASLPLQAEDSVLREEGSGWRRAVQACRQWTAEREKEGSLVESRVQEEGKGKNKLFLFHI